MAGTQQDRIDQIVFAVTDFANALEAAVVNLRKNVKDLAQYQEYDMAMLRWEQREGSKGPYEAATEALNKEAPARDHFAAFQKDLKEHGGKFRKEGYFIWLFQDGNTIGRKKR